MFAKHCCGDLGNLQDLLPKIIELAGTWPERGMAGNSIGTCMLYVPSEFSFHQFVVLPLLPHAEMRVGHFLTSVCVISGAWHLEQLFGSCNARPGFVLRFRLSWSQVRRP